jgi:ribosomal protein S18 acetylase RimI-like enzyme
VSVREATAEDIPAVLQMQQEFYGHSGDPWERAPFERAMQVLIANRDYGRFYVFESGHDTIGYLVITFGFSLEFGGRDAFVDELYVAPTERGAGKGTAALDLAERACREAGIHALHLEVHHHNPRARALYERKGFFAHDRHLMTKRL